MLGISKEVESNQEGLHPRLLELVERHMAHPWQGGIAAHTEQAFAKLAAWRQRCNPSAPLILDSGCGTARSSIVLARRYPDHLVVGVDQSAERLARAERRFPEQPNNLLLLRAEAADLWRLMAAQGWQLAQHYLLYPNPWPKAAHVARRWHGHPAWRELLQLGGQLHCRSNWQIYVEEMVVALAAVGRKAKVAPLHVAAAEAQEALTDFEEKYALSGHKLWQLNVQL